MYPIRFEPIYQDYVWGGERIARSFHRTVNQSRVAESWEMSDRADAMSVVMNGPLKGKTLHQLVEEMGEKLLGEHQKFDRFPLLLKIIDAKENLSIQVHPDEATAPALGGEPKTESWIMLDDGAVYVGLKKEVTQKEFLEAVAHKKAEELIEKLDLKKGETVYIPGGRVHSICAGSLIYEIQQNSDTTYRLYDWGRKGRELHLKEGAAAMCWDDRTDPKISPRHISSDLEHQLVTLISCPFFIVDRYDVFKQFHIAAIPKTFQIFFCLEGDAEIQVDAHKEPFKPGMTYLIPAACHGIDILGKCQLLRIRLP